MKTQIVVLVCLAAVCFQTSAFVRREAVDDAIQTAKNMLQSTQEATDAMGKIAKENWDKFVGSEQIKTAKDRLQEVIANVTDPAATAQLQKVGDDFTKLLKTKFNEETFKKSKDDFTAGLQKLANTTQVEEWGKSFSQMISDVSDAIVEASKSLNEKLKSMAKPAE